MKPSGEHSAQARSGSNRGTLDAWRSLGRCCVLTAGRSVSIDAVLDHLLDATDGERAFLVRSEARRPADDGFVVVASRSRRDETDATAPSRAAVRRALASSRASVHVEIDAGPLAHRHSVRSLGLRSLATAPVPGGPGGAALVVDSRRPVWRSRPERAAELLEAFAALVGIVTRGNPTGSAGRGDGRSSDLATESPVFRATLAWARRVASTHLPVLVRGETGVGKEGLSRALHDWSPRARGPFVAVNCTALNESLLEAELFGSERGAYTGANRDRPGLFRLADRGTLFLDEVGDMAPSMQAKLLRVLEERRVRPVGGDREVAVDVRVIAASHRDLTDAVARHVFRADLFHRIAVLQVAVPPLRDRLDDLPTLVRRLTPRLERETARGPLRLAADAWIALQAHPWPGNVRELHATLAAALLRTDGDVIRAADLDLGRSPTPGCGDPRDTPVSLERLMIEAALHSAEGSISVAAKRIGWTRQKMYRRMVSVGVEGPDESPEPQGVG